MFLNQDEGQQQIQHMLDKGITPGRVNPMMRIWGNRLGNNSLNNRFGGRMFTDTNTNDYLATMMDFYGDPVRKEQPAMPAPTTPQAPKNYTPVQKQIFNAATEFQMDPDMMLRLAELQSNYDPQYANDAGGQGIFGINSDVWNTMLGKYGDQYNIYGDDRFNSNSNAFLGTAAIKEDYNYLRRMLGRDPEGYEMYMSQTLGVNPALSLLRADPNQIAGDWMGIDPGDYPDYLSNESGPMSVGNIIQNYQGMF